MEGGDAPYHPEEDRNLKAGEHVTVDHCDPDGTVWYALSQSWGEENFICRENYEVVEDVTQYRPGDLLKVMSLPGSVCYMPGQPNEPLQIGTAIEYVDCVIQDDEQYIVYKIGPALGQTWRIPARCVQYQCSPYLKPKDDICVRDIVRVEKRSKGAAGVCCYKPGGTDQVEIGECLEVVALEYYKNVPCVKYKRTAGPCHHIPVSDVSLYRKHATRTAKDDIREVLAENHVKDLIGQEDEKFLEAVNCNYKRLEIIVMNSLQVERTKVLEKCKAILAAIDTETERVDKANALVMRGVEGKLSVAVKNGDKTPIEVEIERYAPARKKVVSTIAYLELSEEKTIEFTPQEFEELQKIADWQVKKQKMTISWHSQNA
jgi:hypothetical protein